MCTVLTSCCQVWGSLLWQTLRHSNIISLHMVSHIAGGKINSLYKKWSRGNLALNTINMEILARWDSDWFLLTVTEMFLKLQICNNQYCCFSHKNSNEKMWLLMSPNSRATYSSVCINGKWDDSYIVRFIQRDRYFFKGWHKNRSNLRVYISCVLNGLRNNFRWVLRLLYVYSKVGKSLLTFTLCCSVYVTGVPDMSDSARTSWHHY